MYKRQGAATRRTLVVTGRRLFVEEVQHVHRQGQAIQPLRSVRHVGVERRRPRGFTKAAARREHIVGIRNHVGIVDRRLRTRHAAVAVVGVVVETRLRIGPVAVAATRTTCLLYTSRCV